MFWLERYGASPIASTERVASRPAVAGGHPYKKKNGPMTNWVIEPWQVVEKGNPREVPKPFSNRKFPPFDPSGDRAHTQRQTSPEITCLASLRFESVVFCQDGFCVGGLPCRRLHDRPSTTNKRAMSED